MTLIVEDGSIVDGADSYISLSDARTYTTSRGLSISSTDATAEVQLRRAFDYIESITDYKGYPTNCGQVTQWPRRCVWINGAELSYDTIPTTLKYAQVHVAAAIESGIDPVPNSDGSPFVTQETVGPIETRYSQYVSTSGVPILRVVDNLLAQLVNATGTLTVARA